VKRILVTGSNGFIGSHLVTELKKHYTVFCHDRTNGDLCTHKNFPQVDVVFHLAANVSTHEFYTKSFEVMKNNVTATINICEFYQQQEQKPLFIYAGTAEAQAGATEHFDYKIPTDEACPFVITDPKNLRWSYASSKAIGEQIVIASGLPYIIFRPYNVYGPKQTGHFVPEFIQRALKNKFELHGHANTRSWLHVDDCVQALMLLLENSAHTTGEIFNIGHPKEIAVIDVAKCILKHMKKDVDMGLYSAPVGSVSRRAPDITKIKNAVGWTPAIDLDEGIKNTVETMT